MDSKIHLFFKDASGASRNTVPQFSMTQHRDLSVQKKGFASMSFISPTFLCLHVPQSLFKNFSVVLLSTNALVA